MHITAGGPDAFTTIGTYKLAGAQILLFRGKTLLAQLRHIPGLVAATVFRSYDRRSLVVYLQWKDRISAEAGINWRRTNAASLL